jgi:hypothetical protein
MNDPFKPSASLLVKLGSIIVHYEELTSPNGHDVDRQTLDSLTYDPEVVQWLATMQSLSMLPVKR